MPDDGWAAAVLLVADNQKRANRSEGCCKRAWPAPPLCGTNLEARKGKATRLVSAEMLQPGMDLATWRRRVQHVPAHGI